MRSHCSLILSTGGGAGAAEEIVVVVFKHNMSRDTERADYKH